MFGPSVTQGFRVRARNTDSIRRQALAIRPLLVPKNAPFFEMGWFIERLFDFGITCDVVEAKELPRGVEACCAPEHLLIQFSEQTYSRACRDDPRARFTVIHELGHLAMAHTRPLNRQNDDEIKAFQDSEWQANTFAAEFLMPLDDIKKRALNNPDLLQLEYQVSGQAAETRIMKLRKRGEI